MSKGNIQVAQLADPLFSKAMNSNRAALEDIFSNYRCRLYRTAMHLVRNHHDAEDAVQNGLLSTYLNLRKFEGRSQFSTWFNTIVINEALMQLRRRQSTVRNSLNPGLHLSIRSSAKGGRDSAPNPEQIYERKERVQALGRALHDLSSAYLKPIWFCDVEEMKYREAAEALGVPIRSFKSQLHRARGMLRRKITPVQCRSRVFRNGRPSMTS